jgi:hypothetical protein
MPPVKRLAAADAFWRDDSTEDIEAQHVEALVLLARRLNFRAKSVQALSAEKRARHLAQIGEVSDAIAMRALIAYHFQTQRPLMAAFLDGLGFAHDNGLITGENVAAPEADRLSAAIDQIRAAFPADDVMFYLRTLAALDSDTWGGVEAVLARSG